EIETDKVNQVLSAPATGAVQFSVKTGDVVKVGQVIGFVETTGTGAAVEKAAPPQPKKAPEEKPKVKQPPAGTTPARKSVDEAVQEISRPKEPASPPPRVDVPIEPEEPRTVGRVTRKKMTKLRRVIAERLVAVKNQTALLTTFNELDMSAIMAVREKEQENFQKKH